MEIFFERTEKTQAREILKFRRFYDRKSKEWYNDIENGEVANSSNKSYVFMTNNTTKNVMI